MNRIILRSELSPKTSTNKGMWIIDVHHHNILLTLTLMLFLQILLTCILSFWSNTCLSRMWHGENYFRKPMGFLLLTRVPCRRFPIALPTWTYSVLCSIITPQFLSWKRKSFSWEFYLWEPCIHHRETLRIYIYIKDSKNKGARNKGDKILQLS